MIKFMSFMEGFCLVLAAISCFAGLPMWAAVNVGYAIYFKLARWEAEKAL